MKIDDSLLKKINLYCQQYPGQGATSGSREIQCREFCICNIRATSRSKMSESMLCVQAQKSVFLLWRELSLAVQGAVLDVTSALWPSMINCCIQHSQKTSILSSDGRSYCMENVPCKFSGCIMSAQIWAHHCWANYRYTALWERPLVVQNTDGLSNLYSCWSEISGKYNQMSGLSVKGSEFQSCLFT